MIAFGLWVIPRPPKIEGKHKSGPPRDLRAPAPRGTEAYRRLLKPPVRQLPDVARAVFEACSANLPVDFVSGPTFSVLSTAAGRRRRPRQYDTALTFAVRSPATHDAVRRDLTAWTAGPRVQVRHPDPPPSPAPRLTTPIGRPSRRDGMPPSVGLATPCANRESRQKSYCCDCRIAGVRPQRMRIRPGRISFVVPSVRPRSVRCGPGLQASD